VVVAALSKEHPLAVTKNFPMFSELMTYGVFLSALQWRFAKTSLAFIRDGLRGRITPVTEPVHWLGVGTRRLA